MSRNTEVIVFNDEETEQLEKRHLNNSRNQGQSVLALEMSQLADKVRNLQSQVSSLIEIRSNMTSLGAATQEKHLEQLLYAIERKIQVVSKETKAVSDRLADSFNKKLQAKVSEGASTTDPKQEYSLGLRAAEQHYQTELERYRKQMKETESKMSSRLKYIEDKYKQIIDSFTVKEKEYIDWIHHLELQLADMQKAKAKKIEITQHKVANPAKEQKVQKTEIYRAVSQKDLFQPSNHDETSKNIRKFRIFGGEKQPSISPSKDVSPRKTSQPIQQAKAQVVETKPTKMPAVSKGYVLDPPLKAQGVDMRQQRTESWRNQSPWKGIDKSDQRSEDHRGIKPQLKDVNATQFYRDVPQAHFGWDNFQDLKEPEVNCSDSDDEDEDFVLYKDSPNSHNLDSKRMVLADKVFSPFDMN